MICPEMPRVGGLSTVMTRLDLNDVNRLISRHLAHEGGKVVSRTHRPPLPPRKYSSYSFLLEAEATAG